MIEFVGWLVVILILSPFIVILASFAAAIFTLGCSCLVALVAALSTK